MRRGLACIAGWLAAVAGCAALPGAAGAAELTVASLADSGPQTLRAALETAAANDEPDRITVTASGTIELLDPLPQLGGEIEIIGPGRDQLEVMPTATAPHETFRLLVVGPAGDVAVSGLTLAGGWDRYPFGAAGGAVLNYGALQLTDVAVRDSEAATDPSFLAGGGAIENHGHLVLQRALVEGNRAAGAQAQGGAVRSTGTLVVRDSALRGNLADAPPGRGAGAALYVAGTARIVRSELSGNEVPGGPDEPGQSSFPPAAIVNETADLAIVNTTLSGNDGGIAAWSASHTAVRSSTLVAEPDGFPNLASVAIDVTATVELQNTILARASAAPSAPPNCAPEAQTVLTSGGHNLADDESCAFLGPRDLTGVRPGLSPLTNTNAGLTRVHPVRACSAAADAGASAGLRRDQRGARRPVNRPRRRSGDGADVGAFERQGRPCNRFTARARVAKRGRVIARVKVPGPGVVRVTGAGLKPRRANPRVARVVRLRLAPRRKRSARKRARLAPRRVLVSFRPHRGKNRSKTVPMR